MAKPHESKTPAVGFSESNENWLRVRRLEHLRARGWKGTLKAWVKAFEANGGRDPLTLDPPVTR